MAGNCIWPPPTDQGGAQKNYTGRFETFTRRPIIDCYIHIPSLGVEGPVPFLMDTGADCSVLMPADAERLKVDPSKLVYSRTSTGIGGDCHEKIAPCHLYVADDTTIYGYRFPLGVAVDDPEDGLEEVPSILGMDILRYWKIYFDYPEKVITFTVQMSDDERPLHPSGQK